MRIVALLLLFSASLAAQAEDVRVDGIRTLLVPMRAGGYGLKARGATPALTTVKHELRDWIESRLSVLRWDGFRWNPNPIVLQEQLYFLMRWRPPYHFMMVSAGDLPRPDCTEEDREADEPRSLFSVQ